MFNTFYDKIYVLNQPERQDRRKQFVRNAAEIGLEYEFFPSIKKDSARDSFNWSHYQILKEAYRDGHTMVMVIEDDCAFKSIGYFEDIHIELAESDWSLAYYGVNARPYPDHREPTYYSKHLRKIHAGYTTHAIGYTRNAIEAILWAYAPETGEMYDAFLDRLILPSIGAYVTIPFLCVQKPSFSDLWNRTVDYTDTFQASEEYLRNIC